MRSRSHKAYPVPRKVQKLSEREFMLYAACFSVNSDTSS